MGAQFEAYQIETVCQGPLRDYSECGHSRLVGLGRVVTKLTCRGVRILVVEVIVWVVLSRLDNVFGSVRQHFVPTAATFLISSERVLIINVRFCLRVREARLVS